MKSTPQFMHYAVQQVRLINNIASYAVIYIP